MVHHMADTVSSKNLHALVKFYPLNEVSSNIYAHAVVSWEEEVCKWVMLPRAELDFRGLGAFLLQKL